MGHTGICSIPTVCCEGLLTIKLECSRKIWITFASDENNFMSCNVQSDTCSLRISEMHVPL